jgi:plasmid stability protein
MSQLVVRNIENELVLALKRRAAKHGRSSEAEHHQILREILAPEFQRPSFKDFLTSMPDVGEDEDFAAPRDLPREVRW